MNQTTQTRQAVYPTDRIKYGLACQLAGIDTDWFDNGTPEPWRSIGHRLQGVRAEERQELLRAEIASIPNMDWAELSRDMLAIDLYREPPPDDATPDRPTSLRPVVPFPLDALPDTIREFVREAADMLGCPPDYVAVPLLASASAAVGTTVRLQIKPGWYAWPALYTTVVAPSGAKKTPAMQCALQFVNAKSLEFDQCHENNLKSYEHKLAEYKSVAEHRRRTRGKSDSPELPDKPKRPTLRRVTIADATVEAIGKRLHENPRGLLLVRDEMAGLLQGMNQYRGGHGNDEQFFLSAWSNCRTTIDRKQDDDPVVLHQPFLSITGGIQPGALPKILGRDLLEDGFTARILFSYPDLLPCHSSDATVREETIKRTKRMFETLFRITPAQPDSLPPEPRLVSLSADARESFKAWEDAIGRRTDTLSEDDPFRAPLSKMPGYLGRLALILHILKLTEKDTETFDVLDASTMSEAIALADYFIAHAERVWQRLVESPEDRQMRQLQNWMAKKGRPVTAREILRAGVGGVGRSLEVDALLNRMDEAGLLENRQDGKTKCFWINKQGDKRA